MSGRKALSVRDRIARMKVIRWRPPYPQGLIARLPPRQLLRMVVETPNIQDRLYRCDDCATEALWLGSPGDRGAVCYECRGPSAPLGAAWWAKASGRMRAAC